MWVEKGGDSSSVAVFFTQSIYANLPTWPNRLCVSLLITRLIHSTLCNIDLYITVILTVVKMVIVMMMLIIVMMVVKG